MENLESEYQTLIYNQAISEHTLVKEAFAPKISRMAIEEALKEKGAKLVTVDGELKLAKSEDTTLFHTDITAKDFVKETLQKANMLAEERSQELNSGQFTNNDFLLPPDIQWRKDYLTRVNEVKRDNHGI